MGRFRCRLFHRRHHGLPELGSSESALVSAELGSVGGRVVTVAYRCAKCHGTIRKTVGVLG